MIYVFWARGPKNLTFGAPFLKIYYLGNVKATKTINPQKYTFNVC